MKYILDSDILIYFSKGKQSVVQRVLNEPPESLLTTRINYAELLFGAYHSQHKAQNLVRFKEFLNEFQILEFDAQSAELFAENKAVLKQKGQLIADLDLMIASITLAHSLTLVTNNLKHFERVQKLNIVNWV